MDVKCPRKLDFNAPLLSTRRPGGVAAAHEEMSRTDSLGISRETSGRVPFSWELAPGKPKDMQRSDIVDENPLPPKLPPSRWHLSKEVTDGYEDCNQIHDRDNGCDGDVDDDDDGGGGGGGGGGDNDDDDDVFSDAVDIFSLAESIDIVETGEKVHGLDGLSLEKVQSSGNPSPNFIIERFLPAATALAALSLNKKLPHPSYYPEECISRTGRSYSSSTSGGCGIDTLFPWRMRHKLCGIKFPVRDSSMNLKPQSRVKRKQNSTAARFRKEVG
ncbi:hypothetical protein L1049_007509 [Liquidambar formosana]|uniref:Uncharacterized protein n=1 Tax=Liquidambar formosana TaxID=63359 RepID=A0AAP0S924_LIQFO